jgi:hypothetical protein
MKKSNVNGKDLTPVTLKIISLIAIFALLTHPTIVYSQQSIKNMPTSKIIEENNPIAFTGNPEKQQWRIGFRGLSDIYFLELLPSNREICDEQRNILRFISDKHGYPKDYWPCVVSVPFSMAKKIKTKTIINPQNWTVIDMDNIVRKMSFTQLVAFHNDTYCGCWYMGSDSLREKKQLYYPTELINNHNFVFGIAGQLKTVPKVQLPVTNETDDSYFLPNGHKTLLSLPEMKKNLGKDYGKFKESAKLEYGQSIKAVIKKGEQPEVLWLFHWNTKKDDPDNSWLWGIFNVKNGKLKPLFLSKLTKDDEKINYFDRYSISFVAAIDLNGDGLDEIVTSAYYYEGSAYNVFAFENNAFKKIYSSFYYGI